MQITSQPPRKGKELYHYQENDIYVLFEKLEAGNSSLLYQLPTGG